MRHVVIGLAVLFLSACAALNEAPGQSLAVEQERGALVVKASPYSAVETIDRLAAIVEERGARVFARIDHGEGAAGVGVELGPTVVLIFGNPRMGAPVMQAARTMALDLPLRVLAWEEDGRTRLAYHAPEALAAFHGAAAPEAVARMSQTLDALTDAAIAAE